MNLKRCYPLRGFPGQGQIWSWISFDVANQSFALIINTLLFSVFFQQVVVQDPERQDLLWNLTFATAMLLVVLASPVTGAMADARAWKKRALLFTGIGCATLTCCFALVGPGQVHLAILLYVPAAFFFAIGENFLAAFLPELSERRHIGRVSGFAWGMSYVAALLLLGLTASGMLAFGLTTPAQWRPFFVFAGFWFLLLIIPTLLFLRERAVPREAREIHLVKAGFQRLARTFKNIGQYRDLALLLGGALFFGAAMNVIIMFAAILAYEFGFSDVALVVFLAVITVSGIGGTLFSTLVQDRFGHKRTLLVILALWAVTAIGFIVFSYLRAQSPEPDAFTRWPLWVLGNAIGCGLGALGAATRAFVGFLTPVSRTAEFFGFWGLTIRLSAVITIPFGWAKSVWGTTSALGVLLGFIVVGTVIVSFINEKRGAQSGSAEDGVIPVGFPPV